MRVLLTGMTRMQANGSRRRDYNTSINALYHALKAAKHDVEWRALEYNEQEIFKQFDLLILGLGTISEYSCHYLYETLLASQGEHVLYLVNDWKANKTIRMLMDENLFREFVLNNNTGSRLSKERVMKDRRQLERCRNEMFRHTSNLLGPFFPWGDRDIIIKGTPFTSLNEFNPTAFYLKQWKKLPIAIPKRKKFQWMYGALDNYEKWHSRLGATWPIQWYTKKNFIPEHELVQRYAESHGMLLPKYSASGSGWWRARYCHGMIAQNVMYAEQKEWGELATLMHVNIEDIEEMSAKALQELAAHQQKQILRVTPSWSHVVDTVNNIVQEVGR